MVKAFVALCITIVVIGSDEVKPGDWFIPTQSAENEAYRQQKCAEYHIPCVRVEDHVQDANSR
jgi:hypothetical protein